MRAITLLIATLVVALSGVNAATGAADEPGSFWLDDGNTGNRWELVLRDAVAYRTLEEDYDMRVVSVVLASQPVNRERMRAKLGGEDGLWDTHGPHVTVDLCEREGEWTACGLHVQLGGKSISRSGGHLAGFVESLTVSEDRVRARFATREPLTFFSDTYGLEASVDLAIEDFE